LMVRDRPCYNGLVRRLVPLFLLLFLLPFPSGAETRLFSFGTGPVKVRLYTDYFCGPCSGIEQDLEVLLRELVAKDIISLTFIDVPIHKFTPLYASYFLYVLAGTDTFKEVLRVRALLFDAANQKITERERLESFLAEHGVKFKQIDVRPYLEGYNAYLKEDRIRATPSCVILSDGDRLSYSGSKEVVEALRRLLSAGKR